MRAESSAHSWTQRKQEVVLSGLWQGRFWQMKKTVIKFQPF